MRQVGKVSENDTPSATKINIFYQNEPSMRQAPAGGGMMRLNGGNIRSPVHVSPFS